MKFFSNFTHTRWEIIGTLTAALAAAAVFFWWMNNLYVEREPVMVVAAAHDLTAPSILRASDIKLLSISRNSLPVTAIVDDRQIVGRVLTKPLSANQVITTHDLIYDRDPDSEATLVPSGYTGFVLPFSWLAAPFPKIKKNDYVSVYMAFPQSRSGASGAGVLVSNARVLSVSADKDGQPTSVFLALPAEAVGRMLQARAANFSLVVVAEPLPSSGVATSTAR